jgi:hypothetical protein
MYVRYTLALVLVLALPAFALGGGRSVSAGGVQVVLPAGWERVPAASEGPVTDPHTLLVVGTKGVRPRPSMCQIAAYRIPARAAVVVIVGWKTESSGGGRMTRGRAPLKKLVRVSRPSFECFGGRGAAADLALGVHAYQVNVLVGDRASRRTVEQALAIGRSFDLVHRRASGASPRTERTPPYVLAYCRSAPQLRPQCPHVLPRMEGAKPHWETTVCRAGKDGCRGTAWDDLELLDAGFNGDHPPVWSHISFVAGNLSSAFPFRYPTRGTRPTTVDGLFGESRRDAIFLGSFTWAGHHGTLVLAPSYPAGGEQGDHAIFRWRRGKVSYALGLHAWEPLTGAIAMLRAIVESID